MLHYLDDDFIMKKLNVVLNVLEESTGLNIKEVLDSATDTIFLHKKPPIFYVSDNGKNILKALESEWHVSCMAHNLNLIIQHLIKDGNEHSSLLNAVYEFCKNLVTHFKHTNEQENLSHLLKQETENR